MLFLTPPRCRSVLTTLIAAPVAQWREPSLSVPVIMLLVHNHGRTPLTHTRNALSDNTIPYSDRNIATSGATVLITPPRRLLGTAGCFPARASQRHMVHRVRPRWGGGQTKGQRTNAHVHDDCDTESSSGRPVLATRVYKPSARSPVLHQVSPPALLGICPQAL